MAILTSHNYTKGSLINRVTNAVCTTTGKFIRNESKHCVQVISGQSITIPQTLSNVKTISLFVKSFGDTILVKDGSSTKVSIVSGAIVSTGATKILVNNSLTNVVLKDKWNYIYIEYSSNQSYATNIKIEPTVLTMVGHFEMYDSALTTQELDNKYQYFQNLKSKQVVTHIYDYDNNGKRYQKYLYETFKNYPVGHIYGEPYLTNPRPVVAELTTAQYGYEVGKKYIQSTGVTVGFSVIKNNQAFGTFKFEHVFNASLGTVRIVYISSLRNNATETTVNGYYYEVIGSNRTIAIKRSGATQLLISGSNVFNFGEKTVIEIDRTTEGVQTLIVNRITIGSTAEDLTWTTSENMRIPSRYVDTFIIQQDAN